MPPCMGLGKSSPTNFLPPGSHHYTFAGKDVYGWPPSYESTCCDNNGFEDSFNNEWLPTDFVSDVGIDGGSQYPVHMGYDSAGYGSGVGSSCDTSPLPSWSSIQNSPPPRSTGAPGSPVSSQQQLCRVCNDTATGNHFGVLSCEACKSFFRRSIRAAARYVCRGSKNCDIDKNTRNRCQHCRLQKCFDVGMNKNAVQEERMPYPTKRSKMAPERSVSPPLNQQSPTTPIGGSVSSTTGVPGMPFPFYSLGPTPIHLMNSPFTTDTKTQKSALSTTMMLEILTKAERVEKEPRKVYHSPSSPLTFSKLQENAKKSLINVIAWAKELPMFARLSVEDQLKLIKRSWNELLTLKLVYRNVVLHPGSGLAFQTGEVAQIYQSDDPMVISFFQKVTKECIASMQDIQLDQTEMSCLKLVTLMNPFIHSLSPNGQKDVESAQDAGLELLEAYVKQSKPSSPRRVCKLLLFLGQVKALAKDIIAHIEAQQTLGFESDSVLLELISDSD